MTPRAEKALRRIAVFAVLVIAASAAILSFNGLRNLALTSGIPTELAWLLPITIDGLTLVGSLGVVHAVLTGIPSWYPWMLTLTGVGVSVWGNVASAPPTLTAQIVHAIPPVVLALALEALLKVYRHQAVAEPDGPMLFPGEEPPGPIHDQLTTGRGATGVGAPQVRTLPPAVPLPARSVDTPPPVVPRPLPIDPGSPSPLLLDAELVAPLVVTTPAPTPTVAPTPADAPSQPAPARSSTAKATLREQLQHLLLTNPTITTSEAARLLGKDRSNVAKVMRQLRPTSAEG